MDDDHFGEELGRRTIEIDGLREDLNEAQDRVLEAVERRASLENQITKLQFDITFQQAKALELENDASQEEIRGQNAVRKAETDTVANAEELARLRREMAEGEKSQKVTELEAEEVRQRIEIFEVEVATVRSKFEVVRKDAERERENLAREEAAEQVRQVRFGNPEPAVVSQGVIDAKKGMEEVSATVIATRAEVSRLQAALALEKECTASLSTALKRTVEKRDSVTAQCDALKQELESMDGRQSLESLRDRLTESKSRCQQLSQEVAGIKRGSWLQTQSLQGAVDETRRMISDHREQALKHLEETQKCPEASPLASLAIVLAEARTQTNHTISTRKRFEAECDALQRDVENAEHEIAADKEKLVERHKSDLEESVARGRRALEVAYRAAEFATEEVRKEKLLVLELCKSNREKEALLRNKLEQLWTAIRCSSQRPSLNNGVGVIPRRG